MSDNPNKIQCMLHMIYSYRIKLRTKERFVVYIFLMILVLSFVPKQEKGFIIFDPKPCISISVTLSMVADFSLVETHKMGVSIWVLRLYLNDEATITCSHVPLTCAVREVRLTVFL